MTNIQKGNTVNYLTGVTTNIQKRKYRQLPHWGNDQHTKKEIPSIIFTGVTTNIQKKEILSITFTGVMTTLGKWKGIGTIEIHLIGNISEPDTLQMTLFVQLK